MVSTVNGSLAEGHWRPFVREALIRLVTEYASSDNRAERGIAVFDFDNTTTANDVTEATFGVATASGFIDGKRLSGFFTTPVATPGGRVTFEKSPRDYYFAVAGIRPDGSHDQYRSYPSSLWLGQLFTGRTVGEFVSQVREACGPDEPPGGRGGFPRPEIYPEIADLYGYLQSNGIDVWIVSAGMVWAVRWMVQNILNPMIAERHGDAAKIPLDRVIGVSTLLRDQRTGTLVQDQVLVVDPDQSGYLNLEEDAIANLEITPLVGGAVTFAGGKVAAANERIPWDRVVLAAGDSHGDIPIMTQASTRLWIAPIDRERGGLEPVVREIDMNTRWSSWASWLVQPVVAKEARFVLETSDISGEEKETLDWLASYFVLLSSQDEE